MKMLEERERWIRVYLDDGTHLDGPLETALDASHTHANVCGIVRWAKFFREMRLSYRDSLYAVPEWLTPSLHSGDLNRVVDIRNLTGGCSTRPAR